MQKSSDRLSLTTFPVLVHKPDHGPERRALAVGPVRGAVGPPAAVGLPDATVRAARVLLGESAKRVLGLAVSRGRGRALGSLSGRGGCTSLRGGPVRGSARVLGRGLALATARDQLRSFVDVPLKVTTSLKPSSLPVQGVW